MEDIVLGISELEVINKPGLLKTYGLGSCVGIALFENKTRIAGLAHIMLPNSTEFQNNSNKAKFADTAVVELLKKMIRLGAKREDVVAKLVGGAQMFKVGRDNEKMKIGERNVEASIDWLGKFGVRIVAKDVGGCYGRSIFLSSVDGKVTIKTVGHGEKII